MRKFTTKEIIKIIPMNEDLRKEIQSQFDSYEPERQYIVGRSCWKVFHAFRQEVELFIYNQLMLEVESGKRKMTDTFMDEVDTEVEKELVEIMNGKQSENSEMSDIRNKLQSMMSN
jgi:hypothetical protein